MLNSFRAAWPATAMPQSHCIALPDIDLFTGVRSDWQSWRKRGHRPGKLYYSVEASPAFARAGEITLLALRYRSKPDSHAEEHLAAASNCDAPLQSRGLALGTAFLDLASTVAILSAAAIAWRLTNKV